MPIKLTPVTVKKSSGSLLTRGKIPAYTVCPFRGNCGTAEIGQCKHQGVQHYNAFSCGTARAFDLFGTK